MSSRERTRRWRERLQAGRVVVAIDVDEELVERLIGTRLLAEHLADDRNSIRAALQRLLKFVVNKQPRKA
jgi:hypothetical protein